MAISSNLTLELFDQPFLLEKRIELLIAIKKTGSINKAAKEVPMSYKSAWETIEAMNNLSINPIVQKETGGSGGGGTKLTEYGENLLKTYHLLKEEQKKFVENLNRIVDINNGTLKTIRRLSMQISARNQIGGIVESITKSKINAQIDIKLKSGNILTSVITNKATENLDLKVGDDVIAIFKSSTVLLSLDTNLNISARNQLLGKIENINIDEINSEIIIDIGNEDKIATVITTDSVKSLNLKIGTKINAIIKSSDIMIGK